MPWALEAPPHVSHPGPLGGTPLSRGPSLLGGTLAETDRRLDVTQEIYFFRCVVLVCST